MTVFTPSSLAHATPPPVTDTPAPSTFARLWPPAASLLLLAALVGAVLWWRWAGPLIVKGEQVAVVAPPTTGKPGEPPVMLELDKPLGPGDFAWNEAGATGPSWFVVDLNAREFHAFRGRTEIGRTSILHGKIEKPTPTGTFPISEKDADHISNIYNVPMPFMLRLTNDGVAVHASTVEFGENTHGCIGVPWEFAERLFAEADLGTKVIVVDKGALDSRGKLTVPPPVA